MSAVGPLRPYGRPGCDHPGQRALFHRPGRLPQTKTTSETGGRCTRDATTTWSDTYTGYRPSGAFAGNAGDPQSYDLQKNHRTIIVGSPDTVIEQLQWVVEKLNPGYLLIYGNEGPMPHEDCMRSIELLGKEVIPALKEIQLQPYEAA